MSTKFKKIECRINRNESGSALIVVLGVLMVIQLLTAAIVMLSKSTAASCRTSYDVNLSAYAAEGVQARVQWLLMHDKRLNSDRAIGNAPLNENAEFEPMLADGVEREIEYYGQKIKYTLDDMNTGIDIADSSRNLTKKFNEMKKQYEEDPETLEKLNGIVDKIMDYIDSDDLLRINGAEKVDYESIGDSPLPRDGTFQFRQEICFIPGITDFWAPDEYGRMKSFKLVTKSNRSLARKKPSFFSSPLSKIKDLGKFTEGEMEQIKSALEQWKENRTPLTESLDGVVLGTVKSRFELKESGYYTFLVKGKVSDLGVSRTLAASLKVDAQMKSTGNKYFEWILY